MTLKDYQKYFTLSYDQFITQHNIHGGQIAENRRYEKLEEVNRVTLDDDQWFFFKGSKLKLIYISGGARAEMVWTEFNNTVNTNTPESIVRSRAGKTSNQVIFSGLGITASTTRDTVDFIEIYPPQPLQEYLTNIYRDPGPFIR